MPTLTLPAAASQSIAVVAAFTSDNVYHQSEAGSNSQGRPVVAWGNPVGSWVRHSLQVQRRRSLIGFGRAAGDASLVRIHEPGPPLQAFCRP